MTYCLLLRFDSAGTRPVLVRDDELVASGAGIRYRFIAEADTWAEANAIRELLDRKIETGDV
jgi:hypothetical protein